jgi:DNA-binding NtrC family response regulator
MGRLPQPRPFFITPLLPITASKLSAVGGIAGTEALGIVAGEIGMTLGQADKVATRLRLWPADVWPVEYATYDDLAAEHAEGLLATKQAKRANNKYKYIVKPYEMPHHVQTLIESGLTQSECALILQISRHRIALTLKTYASERAA